MSEAVRGRVLILVENEGLPQDRRVWDEARTLTGAGWLVTALCPFAHEEQAPFEVLEGIEIYRFGLRPAERASGYAREYAQALWRMRRLVRRLSREHRFDVVHLNNPPDFLGLAARPARADGARVVFDHHDLTPELFRARFGGGPIHRLLLAIERRALRDADVVLSTNDSYRRLAIERGGIDPEKVYVVRNGPDLDRFGPVDPDPGLRDGRRHLIAYLGVMGPQDGIDHAVRALATLRGLRGDDFRAVFIGDGAVITEMAELAGRLGVSDAVEFSGWRGDEDIRRILSTADVCLAPDPPSALNDVSTMVKVPEYMAIGCPIASYDLAETRVSAGTAAAYAARAEPASLGRCVHELLEDPARRRRMGRVGRRRVEALSWQRSASVLLDAYEHAVREPGARRRSPDPLFARGGEVAHAPAGPSGRIAIPDPAGRPGDELR